MTNITVNYCFTFSLLSLSSKQEPPTYIFIFTNNEKELKAVTPARRTTKKLNRWAKSAIRFHRQHWHVNENYAALYTADCRTVIDVIKKEYRRLLMTPHQQKFPHRHLQICWNVADNKSHAGWPTLQTPSLFTVTWGMSMDTVIGNILKHILYHQMWLDSTSGGWTTSEGMGQHNLFRVLHSGRTRKYLNRWHNKSCDNKSSSLLTTL